MVNRRLGTLHVRVFKQVKKLQAGCNIRKETGAVINTRPVRKLSSHFEYLENRPRGLDVTWQPVSGDLTVHP
jgi:hypothetical protein